MTLNPYLVPLRGLPLPPEESVLSICGKCGAAWTLQVSCEHYRNYGESVEYLDLSKPIEYNGVPAQLDALEWACKVVADWYGLLPFDPSDVILLRQFFSNARVWRICGVNEGAPILSASDPDFHRINPEDPNCVRLVLAAVLRKGPPETES